MTADLAVVRKMHEGGNSANIFQKHQQDLKMKLSKPRQDINISILLMFPLNNIYTFPQECTVIICKMVYYVIMPKWQKNIKEASGKWVSCVHLD